MLPRLGIEMAVANLPSVVDPLDKPHAWYALIDLSTSRPGGDMRETMEALFTTRSRRARRSTP